MSADKTRAMTMHVIKDILNRGIDEADEETISDLCGVAKHKIDASSLNVDELAADPRIQRALKRFVTSVVVAMQYEEENGEGY